MELPWYKTEKLIQELAWRDYYQQVWIAKKDEIKRDLKNKQSPVSNFELPKAILEASTGIEAVDYAIKKLYETGYMHNHMRMYVASICCNVAQSHWLAPAQWMYSHLLDGDLASNHLSWQWVAGTFSNKKYFANQKNINTYFNSTQQKSFLDVEYAEFEGLKTPEQLHETIPFINKTKLPEIANPPLERNKQTVIYNYYNVDPYWHKAEDVQRILLLEPSFFHEYPVSEKCIDFVLKLTLNIKGIKVFVGEFSELKPHLKTDEIIYKEHPTNCHYEGAEEPREWLSSVKGYKPSFFAFWKKCKRELIY